MARRTMVPAAALLFALCVVAPGHGSAQNPQNPHVTSEWNAPTPYPDRVVLTWSGDPATTQSVTWRTDATVTAASLQYALASPGPGFDHDALTVAAKSRTMDSSKMEGESVIARFHSVSLEGLVPDTLYAYRVGDGERWSEWFHFRTASREPEPFSFIYMGDAQNDVLSLWSRLLRQSYQTAPEARFMIHAGDLINSAHIDLEWGEWFRAGGWLHAMVPSVPTPGNHEYRPFNAEEDSAGISHLSQFWQPQFTLPHNGVEGLEETNYYFDFQGARVVVLNSNREREAQAAWLDRVLADNPNRWTIVTFHHPVFSSARERDNPELRALWKPVLDRHNVDLVLQGHDHSYARGRSGNEATGVNMRDGETGPVYVVSVSGPKMYELTPGGWGAFPATLDRVAENTQLFQVIRIDGDKLEYRSHTATGVLYDSFDLIKGERANRFVERMDVDAPTRRFGDGPQYPYLQRGGGPR